ARYGVVGATVALVAISAIYLIVSHSLTDTALEWSQTARVALVFALLFVVGLLLGVFLPTGMDAVVAVTDAAGTDRDRNVAWCWAVNGFFSVLGSSLTPVVSMTFGFDTALVAGLVLYVVATTVLVTRSSSTTRPA